MSTRTIVVLGLSLFAVTSFAGPKDMVGKPLPTFSLKDVTGARWNNASIKGKPAIIDCWATWCGPCKAASATMQALSKKYASKGLVILAINGYDSAKQIAEYSKSHSYSFPFLVDAKAFQGRLDVVNLPSIFVVDRKGKITGVVTEWNASSPVAFEKLVLAAMK